MFKPNVVLKNIEMITTYNTISMLFKRKLVNKTNTFLSNVIGLKSWLNIESYRIERGYNKVDLLLNLSRKGMCK
jgi:hypothetical protein